MNTSLTNKIRSLILEELNKNNLDNVEKLNHLLLSLTNLHDIGDGSNNNDSSNTTDIKIITKELFNDLIEFVYQNIRKPLPKVEIKDKLALFFTDAHLATFNDFDIGIIQQDFESRDMIPPNITNLKYKFWSNADKNFADGSSMSDYCDEFLDMVYQLNNQRYTTHLKLHYECGVHGHSGGIADYHFDIEEYTTNNPVDNNMIITSVIMSTKSNILDDDDVDKLYTAIEKYTNNHQKIF